MSWPNCHKTIFVLDHGSSMFRLCDAPIELDALTKSRVVGPGTFIPIPQVCKSLWTCAVEAAFEYCRIVWDIYPFGRLIRFIICDSKAQQIGAWSTNQQNLTNVMNNFALLGITNPDLRLGDSNVMHGLSSALEALMECSDAQIEKLKAEDGSNLEVPNKGRVICIGSFRDDSYVRSLESFFQDSLIQINKRNFTGYHMPIHHCDLVLVNVFPNTQTSKIKEHPRLELSPLLSCEVISVRASRWLATRFCSLVLQHYELASTTVTGIPMKEEQNASSSANYDVEIFHPASAHSDILKIKNENALFVLKEGYDYKTVTLKWCTPRATSNTIEMWPCSSAYRISPVDVTSRPSSCLTNFLLGGRSVMLELPRGGAGGRTTSHMLAAHGGEIFLHSLLGGRSVIEDPPSISEGCGGRVTDYRIPDFGELMKENKLVPYLETGPVLPIKRAMARIDRCTQYWPLTISSTLIFHLGSCLEPLGTLIMNEELTDDNVIDCKKVIYNLLAMESRNDALPATASAGHRDRGAKNSRREEQYRILFQELEVLLRRHCRSEQHRRVLTCLLECRAKGTASLPTPLQIAAPIKEEKADTGVIRATTESPLSPPIVTKVPRLDIKTSMMATPGRSLLSMWSSNVAAECSKKQIEFVGRIKAGSGMAKLYSHLDKEHDG